MHQRAHRHLPQRNLVLRRPDEQPKRHRRQLQADPDHCTGGAAIIDQLNYDPATGELVVYLHDPDNPRFLDPGDERRAALERVHAAIDTELDDGDPGDRHGADPARLLPRNRQLPDRRDGDQLDELRAAFIYTLACESLDAPSASPARAFAARRLVDHLDAAGDRSGD